jgi:phosphatidylinositol alpha-1,6-mannosyltransferase
LRICIITSQYGYFWSGLGTYATNLINALADSGHEVHVLCPEVSKDKAHPKVKLIDSSGIKCKATLGNWFLLAYYFNKTIQKLLAKEAFDIIHFADARDSYFCTVSDTPVVGTMHDYYFIESSYSPFFYRKYYTDWPKRWLFYNFTRFMERRALRRLAFVVTNTDYVRDSLRKYYKLKISTTKTIYYGIQMGIMKKGNEPLKGAPSLLFVGGNFQRKGLPTLIRAIASVKEQFPEVALHIVGRDAKEDAMKEMVRETGLGGNVHFLGWKDNDEVRELCAMADIFAMPSLIEGFGLVYLEAMAAGTAAIGGGTGGTPELIEDGINGFLVKPDDWKDLSQKILILTEDETCREKIIQNGYKTLEKYSIDRMLSETIEVYLGLK